MAALVLGGGLLGCAVPDPARRTQQASALAQAAGWQRLDLAAGRFALAAWVPPSPPPPPVAILTVYIEGDGLAWRTPHSPSDDPTPLHALALQLALRHPDRAVVYLARPCQFQPGAMPAACRAGYWTDARYAPEVVDSMDQALDQLKLRSAAHRLVLVGYSGGGAVAALLAARRADIAALVTVAANLDTTVWARQQGLAPLARSLNPADQSARLAGLPQLHLVGADDRVVPPAVLASYAAHFPAAARPTVRVVAGFDHLCCWPQRWPELLAPLLETARQTAR